MPRLAGLNFFLIFILVILEGVLHQSGKAILCDNWPLCFSEWVWSSDIPVLISLIHKMLVVILWPCLVVQFIDIKRNGRENLLNPLIVTSGLFILQATIGAINFYLKVPTLVSTIHLAVLVLTLLSQQLLFRMIILSKTITAHANEPWNAGHRHYLLLTLAVGLFLALTGAMVRHVGAASACGLGDIAGFSCFDGASGESVWWPRDSQGQLNMFHRYFSVVYLFFILNSLYHPWKDLKLWNREIKKPIYLKMILILILFVAQINSGIAVIAELISSLGVSYHLFFSLVQLCLIWGLAIDFQHLDQTLPENKRDSFLSDIIDLAKPRLAALVMATVVVGLLLSPQTLNFFRALLGLASIFLVVMGATTLNCYYEREIDKKMERTQNRPLPAGRLNPRFSFTLGLTLEIVSLGILWFVINPITAILAAIATFTYVWLYTPMKTKGPSAVFVGAIPGAIPPVLGVTMAEGRLGPLAISLFIFLFLWQIPHFMAISLYLSDDYERAGIIVFPHRYNPRNIVSAITGLTFLLLAASWIPYWWNLFNARGQYGVLSAGIFFSALSLLGLKRQKNIEFQQWARQYFIGSIIYLPFVLLVYLIL